MSLDIRGLDFSAEAISQLRSLPDRQLMQFSDSANLTTVVLMQTKVTEDGMEDFVNACPDCVIYAQ